MKKSKLMLLVIAAVFTIVALSLTVATVCGFGIWQLGVIVGISLGQIISAFIVGCCLSKCIVIK